MSPAKKVDTGPVKLRGDRRVLLAIPVVLVLLAAIWFLFASPALNAATQAAQKEADAAAKAQSAATQLKGLETGLTPMAEGQLLKAVTLDNLLPATADPVALGTSLTQYAASTGVSISSFTKGTAYPVGAAQAQAYEVTASGSQAQLSAFLSGVAAYPQLLTVPVVSLASGAPAAGSTTAYKPSTQTAAAGQMTAQMTLLAWSSSEPVLALPPEAKAQAEAAAAAQAAEAAQGEQNSRDIEARLNPETAPLP